jgi:hypothetical protein
MKRMSPGKGIPTSIFCGTFYFMALVGICFAVLPRDALAIFGGFPQERAIPVALKISGFCLLLGIILHIIFYRLNPERFDSGALRFTLIGMVILLAGFFILSFGLSRGTRLPPQIIKQRFDRVMWWIGVTVVGGLGSLLAILFLALFVILKIHPGNRIARKLQASDAAGAIAIAESLPPARRDFTVKVNLTVAYVLSGQMDKARELLSELESTEGIPKHYTAESLKQTLDNLRQLFAKGPTKT